jgi:2-desacetyl-2-hydroxyethyl bacteriochlorophyllide A dehydrogenase
MPETMRAALLTGLRQVEVQDVPKPTPHEGWVLMKVEACGICGSDLRYFEGENPWSLHTLGYHKPLPPRMILGHELAGTIEAVGPGGDGSRVGDRVVALCFEVCGECPSCLRGDQQLCPNTQHLGHGAGFDDWDLNPGGYAQYCLVWENRALPLPQAIGYGEAAFLDGLAVAVHAVKRVGVGEGDHCLVLGCGPIGLLCAQVAAARGAEVIATEIDRAARGHAQRLVRGAVLDPSETDPGEFALRATEGFGVQGVIDTTGSLAAQESGIACLAPAGGMVFLAGPADGLHIGLKEIAGERWYSTSANFDPPELQEAIDLLAAGDVSVEGLITHHFPLDDAAEALDTMDRKKETGAYKIIIQPWP